MRPLRLRPRVESLEARILYSADPASAVFDAMGSMMPVERRVIDAPVQQACVATTTSDSAPALARHELVLVDTRVANWQQLVDDIPHGANRDVEIVLLDPTRDGIEQISEHLAQEKGLDAVHIVSHGEAGALQIGTTRLDFDTLLADATAVSRWRLALNSGADIMLYGCDLAASSDGRALVDAMSRLTGADVAASVDTTGGTAAGGDWVLEYSTGVIQADALASASNLAAWNGSLGITSPGTETRVNTTTSGTQTTWPTRRDVAIDASGNFVIAWNDETSWDVYVRRYDSAGNPLSNAVRVNTNTSSDAERAVIAMNASGMFVVVWQSDTQDAGSNPGIYAQIYDASGATVGNVFQVNKTAAGDHPLQVSLTQVHRTAVRGRSLVQQILAFSRRQPQAFVVQPMRPLIEEAVGMLRPMLPAMVRVETSFPNAPAWVDADSTQIHQVLINLCVNAWHAMQGSTGCIQIGLEIIEDTPGTAAGSGDGRRAHLWVRDNGSGMDAETRARIFEPFFTTKSGHGTGLGLAVVHGIVLAHRGTISVDSTIGRGSTFHLLLPLAPAPADEEQVWLPSARGELPSAEGRHVLYVDDDEVMALMVERLLQRSGYRVSAFQDAAAALETVRAAPESFDVAVCDFNMPVLSGLDFARALGSIRPQLPVIISSGHLPEEAQVEAVRLGVRGLLQKQNTFDELDRLIRRVLAQATS